jgi:hypothetical protein
MEAYRNAIAEIEWMTETVHDSCAAALAGMVGPDTVQVVCSAINISLQPLFLYVTMKLWEQDGKKEKPVEPTKSPAPRPMTGGNGWPKVKPIRDD